MFLQRKDKDGSALNLEYDDYFNIFDINKSPKCFEDTVKSLNKDIRVKLQMSQFFTEIRLLYWFTKVEATNYKNHLSGYKKVIV
jgi:hypothetical protein